MAVTTATKDLVKTLTAYLSAPSPTVPLPDEITQVIEAYLAKHKSQDDVVHEELLQLYQRLVRGHPARIASFLAIQRLLRPGIWFSPNAVYWFDVLCDDVLDHIWQNKPLENEVILNYETVLMSSTEGSEGTAPVMGRCLERWMQYAQAPLGSEDAASRYKEKKIQDMLLAWGKKSPKLFMNILDPFFVKKDSRARITTLLCEFVQSQPPHLHVTPETTLFAHLLTCLQRDASTTVVSLALTALAMLLPNFPNSLVPHLPALFNIYARLLFWDRERTADTPGFNANPNPEEDFDTWVVMPFSADTETTEIPQLLNYFTILYGLYPLNFIDYIRKPQRWLRHANAPNPDDIEVQPSEIRHRSERLRQMHLLHPNFYSLTIETEKTDFGRWIKSEPSDVVAECMALCVSPGPGADSLGPMPLGEAHQIPSEEAAISSSSGALLSSSVVFSPPQGPLSARWRHTQSTAVDSASGSRPHSAVVRQNSQSSHVSTRDSLENRGRETGVDSPTFPPLLVSSPSQSQLQEMIRSNKAIKSGLGQSLTNDSVPSLSLSHQESNSERPPASVFISQLSLRSPHSETGSEIARLERQIMVLKNDLNFERYMKQQHMAHIGELRRRHMKEVATESETQTLIMHNRNLKNRLEEAKRAELQVRKDSERSRTIAQKWESELSAKLRLLRDEQRKRIQEMDALKRDLSAAKEECEKLRALVCEAEVKELNSKQATQSIDINIAELTRLRTEVERLTASERDYQAKQTETEGRLGEAAEAEHRAGILEAKVVSLDSELQATRDQFQAQIVVLNAKLAEALKSSRGRNDSELTDMFGSAMAASRAKQAELQKQYSQLLQRYSALQSSMLDQAHTSRSQQALGDGSESAEADAQVSAIMGASFSARTRMQRGMSDPNPDLFELSQQDSFGSATSTMTALHRPDMSGASLSPQSERQHGRGAISPGSAPHPIRKERKEKKKDEQDRRERKSSSRGIRGFP